MVDVIKEGSAVILAETKKPVNKKLPVFYNPLMKLNRDISVLILKCIGRKGLRIGLPLEGTGVRGIRFLKELPNDTFKSINFNDNNKTAVENIFENLKLNNINLDFVSVACKDANIFFEEQKSFDYIDIDPFGSPNMFLDAGIKKLSRNGILAVTATDTAPLSGTYPFACLRKYYSRPIRNELKHEAGIRILIRKIQLIGAQYDKALLPVFSYSSLHYFRIFFIAKKGKKECDELVRKHLYLNYCDNCLNHSLDEYNRVSCENCGSKTKYAGPLYSGNIFDRQLCLNMFKTAEGSNKQLTKLLETISCEAEIGKPFFYDIHTLAKKYHFEIPRMSAILESIPCSSRTHFSDTAIKTTLSLKEVLSILLK